MSEFLGPRGKATIILMRSHFDSELPKLKDLKKILHIPDGRYYKSAGRNSHEIRKLERLLSIRREIQGEEQDWHKNGSTDYLATVAEVDSNLFMTLKYDAQVVDGFNLTDSAIEALERLLEVYGRVCDMRDDVDRMWQVLSRNSEIAAAKDFADSTILKPNLPALQEILAGYGDAQYAQACQGIEDWYATHQWKVRSPAKAKKASEEDDETADAAVI